MVTSSAPICPGVTPAALQGVITLLERITAHHSHCPLLQSPFHSTHTPPMTVRDYCERVLKYSRCTGEAFVVAVLLVVRFSHTSKQPITPYNVHRLLITATLLAAKARDDEFFCNSYYSKIGGIPVEELNRLEVLFLEKIQWDVWMEEDVYMACLEAAGSVAALPLSAAATPNSVLSEEVDGSMPSSPTAPAATSGMSQTSRAVAWLTAQQQSHEARHQHMAERDAHDLQQIAEATAQRPPLVTTPTTPGSRMTRVVLSNSSNTTQGPTLALNSNAAPYIPLRQQRQQQQQSTTAATTAVVVSEVSSSKPARLPSASFSSASLTSSGSGNTPNSGASSPQCTCDGAAFCAVHSGNSTSQPQFGSRVNNDVTVAWAAEGGDESSPTTRIPISNNSRGRIVRTRPVTAQPRTAVGEGEEVCAPQPGERRKRAKPSHYQDYR